MIVGAKLVVLYVQGGRRAAGPDGYVRSRQGPGSRWVQGAEPPTLAPRSGKFCRFETLEGHFLVKMEVLAL